MISRSDTFLIIYPVFHFQYTIGLIALNFLLKILSSKVSRRVSNGQILLFISVWSIVFCFISDPKILYETPRRVFARLSDSPLSMSDYVFMDETHVEVIDRMKDLLALDLTEEHMEFECEKLPGMWTPVNTEMFYQEPILGLVVD